MNNLAELLRAQRELGEAEPLYEQALRAQRDWFGCLLALFLGRFGVFFGSLELPCYEFLTTIY